MMKKFKLSLMVLCLLGLLVPFVSAPDPYYISDCPVTITSYPWITGKPFLWTIDVTPKYYQIVKGQPLTWTIHVKIEVLESDVVSEVPFLIVFVDESCSVPRDEFYNGAIPIKDSSCNIVGYMDDVGKLTFWPGEVEYIGTYAQGVVTTDGFFDKGEYFWIEIEADYPRLESCNLDRGGIRDMFFLVKNDQTRFYYYIGSEYLTERPPVLFVPEVPLGALSVIGVAILGLFLHSRKLKT